MVGISLGKSLGGVKREIAKLRMAKIESAAASATKEM
jgi:hypothetical protein